MSRALVLVMLVMLAVVPATLGCRRPEETARPVHSEQHLVAPVPLVDDCPPDVETTPPTPMPEYVRRIADTELYVRVTSDGGPTLVIAPPADLDVVRAYPTARIRGPLVAGTRVTILAAKKAYRVNDELRVIHVAEFDAPGVDVFVMGPKPVTGEYLDDKLVTEPVPSWGAFTTGVYDGAVMKSPWADTNYEITTYRLTTSGLHRVQWRAGPVSSNVLCVRVSGA